MVKGHLVYSDHEIMELSIFSETKRSLKKFYTGLLESRL